MFSVLTVAGKRVELEIGDCRSVRSDDNVVMSSSVFNGSGDLGRDLICDLRGIHNVRVTIATYLQEEKDTYFADTV